jgi:hypothetical protein
MLVALSIPPSFAIHPITPLFSSLFSATSANSVLKTPPEHHHRILHAPPTTQPIPSFSTPSKHGPHRKARKPFRLYCLLHDSLDSPGVGHSRLSTAPFPLDTAPRSRPNPAHNSFRCNAYKKQGAPPSWVQPPALIFFTSLRLYFIFATLSVRGAR